MKQILALLLLCVVMAKSYGQEESLYDFTMQHINETKAKIAADPTNPLYCRQLQIFHRTLNMYEECLNDINTEISLFKAKYVGEDMENGRPARLASDGYENMAYTRKTELFSKYNRKAEYLVYLNRINEAYTLANKYQFGYIYNYKPQIDLFMGNTDAAINGFKNQQSSAIDDARAKLDWINSTNTSDYTKSTYRKQLDNAVRGDEKTNMGMFVGYLQKKDYYNAKQLFNVLLDTVYAHSTIANVERINGQKVYYTNYYLGKYAPVWFNRSKNIEPYVPVLLDYLMTNNYDSAYAMIANFRFGSEAVKRNADGSTKYDNKLLFQCAIYSLKADLLSQRGQLEEALAAVSKSKLLNPYNKSTDAQISRLQSLIAFQKQEDKKGPEIEVYQPTVTRNTTITNDLTTDPANKSVVIGRAIDISGIRSVKVNGTKADVVEQDGTFRTQLLSFSPTLTIEAQDNNGNNTVATYLVKQTDSSYIPPIDEAFHAIMIACDHYTNMRPLASPIKEAEALSAVLSNTYGFTIQKLYDKTYDDINKALISTENLKESDNLIIYYAGHGTARTLPDGKKVGFWVPVAAQDESQYISSSKLSDAIKGCKARHILIISDACFSAAMIPSNFNLSESLADQMKSVEFMSSGSLEEVPDPSYFIQQVTDQLGNIAKPSFNVKVLFNRIYEPVADRTSKEPILTSYSAMENRNGHFYFKRK